jgi:septum formation protein
VHRIWLASGSPRRRQLLEWVGYAVDVHPSGAEEVRAPGEHAVAYAERLAEAKAAGVPADRVGLAADTVVHLGDAIFEKPVDRDDAVAILRALSGRWHEVTTAVCAVHGDVRKVLHVTTDVRFRELSDAEIAAYVATGEADDKAGAYGIQGRAGSFVAEVRGSWTNVMGLPIEAVLPILHGLHA